MSLCQPRDDPPAGLPPLPYDPHIHPRQRRARGPPRRETADITLCGHKGIEQHRAGNAGGGAGGKILQPDQIEIEIRIAAPLDPFERRAVCRLRKITAAPCAVRESEAEMAHFGAVDPYGVFA